MHSHKKLSILLGVENKVFKKSLKMSITNNICVSWLQLWSLGPNKLQGVGICQLINYTPIIFSSKLIWIDLNSPKIGRHFRKCSASKLKIIKKCCYSLSHFKRDKRIFKKSLVKSSDNNFIFLPAFYLIIWLMTSLKIF